MKIASFRADGRSSFGIVDGGEVIDIGGEGDLRGALASGQLAELAKRQSSARRFSTSRIEWLPVIPNPDKILCIGVNYDTHRRETGRAEAKYPTIFLRLANAQTGHLNNIVRPRVSHDLDYEGELAVILGKTGRHIPEKDAFSYVAGYSCFNDATLRDWQRHSHQFTPGKNFWHAGAFGPWLTTADEVPDVEALHLTTRVNGEVMQDAGLDQLIFSIPKLIAYCSTFTRLEPGDVICTGTPGGVGFLRTPPVYLKPGDRVEVEISGVGTLVNGVEDEAAS